MTQTKDKATFENVSEDESTEEMINWGSPLNKESENIELSPQSKVLDFLDDNSDELPLKIENEKLKSTSFGSNHKINIFDSSESENKDISSISNEKQDNLASIANSTDSENNSISNKKQDNLAHMTDNNTNNILDLKSKDDGDMIEKQAQNSSLWDGDDDSLFGSDIEDISLPENIPSTVKQPSPSDTSQDTKSGSLNKIDYTIRSQETHESDSETHNAFSIQQQLNDKSLLDYENENDFSLEDRFIGSNENMTRSDAFDRSEEAKSHCSEDLRNMNSDTSLNDQMQSYEDSLGSSLSKDNQMQSYEDNMGCSLSKDNQMQSYEDSLGSSLSKDNQIFKESKDSNTKLSVPLINDETSEFEGSTNEFLSNSLNLNTSHGTETISDTLAHAFDLNSSIGNDYVFDANSDELLEESVASQGTGLFSSSENESDYFTFKKQIKKPSLKSESNNGENQHLQVSGTHFDDSQELVDKTSIKDESTANTSIKQKLVNNTSVVVNSAEKSCINDDSSENTSIKKDLAENTILNQDISTDQQSTSLLSVSRDIPSTDDNLDATRHSFSDNKFSLGSKSTNFNILSEKDFLQSNNNLICKNYIKKPETLKNNSHNAIHGKTSNSHNVIPEKVNNAIPEKTSNSYNAIPEKTSKFDVAMAMVNIGNVVIFYNKKKVKRSLNNKIVDVFTNEILFLTPKLPDLTEFNFKNKKVFDAINLPIKNIISDYPLIKNLLDLSDHVFFNKNVLLTLDSNILNEICGNGNSLINMKEFLVRSVDDQTKNNKLLYEILKMKFQLPYSFEGLSIPVNLFKEVSLTNDHLLIKSFISSQDNPILFFILFYKLNLISFDNYKHMFEFNIYSQYILSKIGLTDFKIKPKAKWNINSFINLGISKILNVNKAINQEEKSPLELAFDSNLESGSKEVKSPVNRIKEDNSSVTKSKDNSSVTKSKNNSSVTNSKDNSSVTKSEDNPSVTKSEDNPSVTKSKDNPSVTKSKDNPSVTKSVNHKGISQPLENKGIFDKPNVKYNPSSDKQAQLNSMDSKMNDQSIKPDQNERSNTLSIFEESIKSDKNEKSSTLSIFEESSDDDIFSTNNSSSLTTTDSQNTPMQDDRSNLSSSESNITKHISPVASTASMPASLLPSLKGHTLPSNSPKDHTPLLPSSKDHTLPSNSPNDPTSLLPSNSPIDLDSHKIDKSSNEEPMGYKKEYSKSFADIFLVEGDQDTVSDAPDLSSCIADVSDIDKPILQSMESSSGGFFSFFKRKPAPVNQVIENPLLDRATRPLKAEMKIPEKKERKVLQNSYANKKEAANLNIPGVNSNKK